MQKIITNIAFLVLLCTDYSLVYGQDSLSLTQYEPMFRTYKKTEVLTGVSVQQDGRDDSRSLWYAEIGIARSIHSGSRHGPVSIGVYGAEEFYFGSNTTVYGTKIGAYTQWLFDLGLAMIYYTDLKKGNFKIRPEFGFGMGALRLVAGYNIPTIDNKAFELLKKNNGQVSLQFLIPVKKKEEKEIKESIFRQLFKR